MTWSKIIYEDKWDVAERNVREVEEIYTKETQSANRQIGGCLQGNLKVIRRPFIGMAIQQSAGSLCKKTTTNSTGKTTDEKIGKNAKKIAEKTGRQKNYQAYEKKRYKLRVIHTHTHT